MKMMIRGLCLLALACFAITSTKLWGGQDDEKGIRETIGLYFRGDIERDVEALKKAFHPTATLLTSDKEGRLQVLTQPDWYERIRKTPGREKPAAKILQIDQAGNVASAKTQLVFSNGSFTDYLSLVKIGGRWTIVNKVYHWQTR
jgi:hypothetical protein